MQTPVDSVIQGVFYYLRGVGYKLDLLHLAMRKHRIQDLVTKREGGEWLPSLTVTDLIIAPYRIIEFQGKNILNGPYKMRYYLWSAVISISLL